jgi:twitching motility two-component system response regulator PilG
MNKLIMTIDDSPTVRKIIEVSLQREGFEVASYPDGVTALQAITMGHAHRTPDLMILDIDLPKMNGYEIARYVRSKPYWNQIVIVMLSRHDGMVDRLKARLAGTQTYLTKPFTTQRLLEVIQTVLQLPQPSSVTPS